jgi:peptidoglycan/xylan/chitin deacetylase (PgdA/CDA1 family)
MAGGYSPDGVCHGRTAPFLQDYIMRLCTIAEEFGVRLHFFQIANGLEVPNVVEHLREVISRGHIVDCHTYAHVNLAITPADVLDEDLRRAAELFEEQLGFRSEILRGPGGYPHNALAEENQRLILKHGYRWVSGEVDYELPRRDEGYWISSPSRGTPFRYPTGLIEIPIQGWTDRMWFEGYKCIDDDAYARWRRESGHKPVRLGWRCPWTARDALDEWIRINLATLDYAYEHRLLWVVCWHPYSHYLHDPDARMLRSLLETALSKPDVVWVCTLRDVVEHILEGGDA